MIASKRQRVLQSVQYKQILNISAQSEHIIIDPVNEFKT